VLKLKLAAKNIEYVEISDINVITAKGIKSVPVLEVDGEMLNLSQANDFIKTL
jgi:hypothetical protein